MSKYTLYIVIEGPGHSAQYRSHWLFAFRRSGSDLANIYQVLVLDDFHQIYGFDRRDGIPFPVSGCEGAVKLAELAPHQYVRAQQVLLAEPAPKNGWDRFQDWTLNCVIGLEVEEILGVGTAELLAGLVGRSAAGVEEMVRSRWVLG